IVHALLSPDFLSLQDETISYWARSLAQSLLDDSKTAGSLSEALIALSSLDAARRDEWARRHSPGGPAVSGSLPWTNPDALDLAIQHWLTDDTIGALGLLCAFLRWGEVHRLPQAIAKLRALSRLSLYGTSEYSLILTKLSAEICQTYIDSALRSAVLPLSPRLTADGRIALERYLRYSYITGKSIAWSSQRRGIARLSTADSFALCTPTGSGKTAIAELAILQSLFPATSENSYEDTTEEAIAPIALYLVPSRALATEVESKLSRVWRTVAHK